MNAAKLIVAAVVAAAAAVTQVQAQRRGDCVRVALTAPLLLPDGSQFERANLKICVDRRLTPVSVLHSIHVNGIPTGFFVSLDQSSESVDGAPRIGFRRTADGSLRLAAYTSQDGSRGRTFRFRPAAEPLRADASTPSRDEVRDPEEPVWIAARLH